MPSWGLICSWEDIISVIYKCAKFLRQCTYWYCYCPCYCLCAPMRWYQMELSAERMSQIEQTFHCQSPKLFLLLGSGMLSKIQWGKLLKSPLSQGGPVGLTILSGNGQLDGYPSIQNISLTDQRVTSWWSLKNHPIIPAEKLKVFI